METNTKVCIIGLTLMLTMLIAAAILNINGDFTAQVMIPHIAGIGVGIAFTSFLIPEKKEK